MGVCGAVRPVSQKRRPCQTWVDRPQIDRVAKVSPAIFLAVQSRLQGRAGVGLGAHVVLGLVYDQLVLGARHDGVTVVRLTHDHELRAIGARIRVVRTTQCDHAICPGR